MGMQNIEKGVDHGMTLTIQCSQVKAPVPYMQPVPMTSSATSPSQASALDLTHLLHMVQATYFLLNSTSANLGADCWLCLNPKLPFYIGLGLLDKPSFQKAKLSKSVSLTDGTTFPWETPLFWGTSRGIPLTFTPITTP